MTPDSEIGWSSKEKENELYLDAVYDLILRGGYVIVQQPTTDLETSDKISFRVLSVDKLQRAAYGISARTTRLKLDRAWFAGSVDMKVVCETVVLAQSEELELAEGPIFDEETKSPEDIFGDTIELDGVYEGIQSGRWIIISGERTDLDGTTGVRKSELAMVATAQNKTVPTLPGDTSHTVLTLAIPLAYRYKRNTVIINANVVKATQGETRIEVLGSGDAAESLQEFMLKQFPLTHVSAATSKGTTSTLKVRINGILWHETETLDGLAPTAQKYITATDNENKTSVTFGNGHHGSRLPTGVENVKAEYRTGIGSIGNVKAGQISLLATRPLGVKSVNNPIRASGGADRENRDQARDNAPLVTMALDRLVSVQDYADYARTFAGIGKADARMITDGSNNLIHLTIAGANDIPIDETSDLYQNLEMAIKKYGDPYQPVLIALRECIAILIQAKVKLLPDFAWDTTEPKIRNALCDAFSFDHRELGQGLFESEVVSVIKRVPGVDFTEMQMFTSLNSAQLQEMMVSSNKIDLVKCSKIIVSLARFDQASGDILPAQIAYLLPDVPDTLILNEVKE